MKFVVCIKNKDYPADLLLHKIYRVIPDPNMEPEDIRVVDESGKIIFIQKVILYR